MSYYFDPHRLSPREAPTRLGPAIVAYVLGRDRRHPIGWFVALVALAVVLIAVASWWPFAVLGLLGASGAYVLASRHDIPPWAWPVAGAVCLLAAVVFLPSLLVSAGLLVGALRGRRALAPGR